MIAHYKGLNVKQLDKIRDEMRKSGIFSRLLKIELQNWLLKIQNVKI